LEQQKERLNAIIPGIISNSDYSEVPGWKIERSDTNFRGQSGLCEDLQCSKIAAPAKVKEIVSNQLSLVIEPDYSQQKNAWVSKSRSKPKSKPKSKQNQNQILIIKIEF
jgi:hypothetical protein